MKFRKRSYLVEAFQWFKHGDVPEVTTVPFSAKITDNRRAKLGWLETPQGGHLIFPGDWVIIDGKGQLTSCNSDTFTRLYESAEQRILPMPSERGRSV